MANCNQCKTSITSVTFERNDGLCMPCSSGQVRDFSSDIPLHIIGLWKNEDNHNLPDPLQIFPIEWDIEVKEKVIKYLKSGEELRAWLDYSFCRFDCGVHFKKMGTKDLYDGVWMWPEGFVHYIEVHNLPIPDAFLEHMKECGYSVRQSLSKSSGVNCFVGDQEMKSIEEWIEVASKL